MLLSWRCRRVWMGLLWISRFVLKKSQNRFKFNFKIAGVGKSGGFASCPPALFGSCKYHTLSLHIDFIVSGFYWTKDEDELRLRLRSTKFQYIHVVLGFTTQTTSGISKCPILELLPGMLQRRRGDVTRASARVWRAWSVLLSWTSRQTRVTAYDHDLVMVRLLWPDPRWRYHSWTLTNRGQQSTWFDGIQRYMETCGWILLNARNEDTVKTMQTYVIYMLALRSFRAGAY
jgi:hypothetical protein